MKTLKSYQTLYRECIIEPMQVVYGYAWYRPGYYDASCEPGENWKQEWGGSIPDGTIEDCKQEIDEYYLDEEER